MNKYTVHSEYEFLHMAFSVFKTNSVHKPTKDVQKETYGKDMLLISSHVVSLPIAAGQEQVLSNRIPPS